MTLVVQPVAGFHPADNELAEANDVRRVAVLHLQLLDDGTYVLLLDLRGNLERANRILHDHPAVISCEVSGNTTGIGFIHANPTDTTKTLLELLQQFEIVIETPIEYVSNDGVKVTLAGESSVLQRALSQFPADVDVKLERTGSNQQLFRKPTSLLTERQHGVLTAAVDAGYHEIPRQTTQEQLAAHLNIAPATLHEHLRKIEKRIFEHVI